MIGQRAFAPDLPSHFEEIIHAGPGYWSIQHCLLVPNRGWSPSAAAPLKPQNPVGRKMRLPMNLL